MNRYTEIKSAYRALGKEATLYDGMITCSTLLGKAVCRLVWAMGQAETDDYLSRAQRRAKRDGLTHVRFQQGDVGNLPFPDVSFDIVLSLNGFHAFPDKEAAYREVFRVLKPGGCFCGCFYVAGETARTDWFIRHLYEPKGFFTPPYETADSLKQRLERQYEAVEFSTVKSIACFTCRKGGHDR